MATKFFRNSNFSNFLGIKSEINQWGPQCNPSKVIWLQVSVRNKLIFLIIQWNIVMNIKLSGEVKSFGNWKMEVIKNKNHSIFVNFHEDLNFWVCIFLITINYRYVIAVMTSSLSCFQICHRSIMRKKLCVW